MQSRSRRYQVGCVRTEDKSCQVDFCSHFHENSLISDNNVLTDFQSDDNQLTYAQRESTLLAMVLESKEQVRKMTEQHECRESQITRLSCERKQLQTLLVECRGREREMRSVVDDLQLCLRDLQIKNEEQMTMSNLRELEHYETVESLQSTTTRLMVENRRLTKLINTLTQSYEKCFDANVLSSLISAQFPVTCQSTADV